MIAIIDYGAGNLSSVAKAVSVLGGKASITSDPEVVRKADVLIMPGVGAAGDAMRQLEALHLSASIVDSIRRGTPFLGICLGLQLLLSDSEESGGLPCLGVVPGTVRRLPPGLKVPHIGWNQVRQCWSHVMFDGIPDGADFYFVHSYYPDPRDNRWVAGETEYAVSFCSMLVSENIVATQFHPEKSGRHGLRLLDNFLRFAGMS